MRNPDYVPQKRGDPGGRVGEGVLSNVVCLCVMRRCVSGRGEGGGDVEWVGWRGSLEQCGMCVCNKEVCE